MGYFSEQLREYLVNRTPEQKAEDEALMLEYADCGGSAITEYEELLSDTATLKFLAERCMTHVLSGEFEKAQTVAMEYNELNNLYQRKYGTAD